MYLLSNYENNKSFRNIFTECYQFITNFKVVRYGKVNCFGTILVKQYHLPNDWKHKT